MRVRAYQWLVSLLALSTLLLSGCTHPCVDEPERCADELHLYDGLERPADELAIIEDVSGHHSFREIRWPDGTLIYSDIHGNYFDPDLTREGLQPGSYLYQWRVPTVFHLLPGKYRIYMESTGNASISHRRKFTSYRGTVHLQAGHKYQVDTEHCYFFYSALEGCKQFEGKTHVYLEDMDTGDILLGVKPTAQTVSAEAPATSVAEPRRVGATETKIFLSEGLSWVAHRDGEFRSGHTGVKSELLGPEWESSFKHSKAMWQKGARILEVTVLASTAGFEFEDSDGLTEETANGTWPRLEKNGIYNFNQYDCQVDFCATFASGNQDCAAFSYVTSPVGLGTSGGKKSDYVVGYYCGQDGDVSKEIDAILGALQIRLGE